MLSQNQIMSFKKCPKIFDWGTKKMSKQGFTIRRCITWPERGWYIVCKTKCNAQFLHKDLILHNGTGYTDRLGQYEAPGYYGSEFLASIYLDAYLEKQEMDTEKDYIVSKTGNNKKGDLYCTCGWFAAQETIKGTRYLHKDLQFHSGTGIASYHKWGEAPGYYISKDQAEKYLGAYLQRQKIRDLLNKKIQENQMPENRNIKITVEVDGSEVPLETISTETFEKIKAAAKEPEYEGVYLGKYGNLYDRVIFEVTDHLIDRLSDHKNQVVMIDEFGNIVNYYSTLKSACNSNFYSDIKKLGS